MDLSGKVAIVTGSGGGLGLAYVQELARAQIAVNAVVPVAATATTETVPFVQPSIEMLKKGAFLAADAIAGVWAEEFAAAQQTVGRQLPQEPGR